MLEIINNIFNQFIDLGGSAMMFIILTILAIAFRVKISKAFEGGLRMAIALTGMSCVISLLTEAFSPALNTFVESTGIELSITDLGWAPLAVITWGSVYTLYFAAICIALNILYLIFNVTNTLNVDLFNIWNVSIVGLLVNHYAHNIVITSVFVFLMYTAMLLNSDAMKPALNKILHYDEKNITTTAHACFLMAPFAMLLNKILDICIPFIDKYDFNAEKLNQKIGFLGSKFAIGCYLGVLIGVLGQQSAADIFTLAFTGGVALELFGIIGGWFGPAIEPLSSGIQKIMDKKFKGRKLYVGIDWSIAASSSELWAVVNILAPILLLIAMVLPGNKVMPLGGILMTVSVPAILIVTQGRVLRMTIIGTIFIPIYLWSATLVSEFITSASAAMNNIPSGLEDGQLFTSIDSNPVGKIIALILGQGVNESDILKIVVAVAAIIVYALLFIWYRKELQKSLNK